MNSGKEKEAELGNSLLAIIGGAATAFLTGLILSPFVQFMADRFLEFDLFGPRKALSVNDIILWGAILIWILVATLASGLVCSLICRVLEYNHALVLSGILFVLILFGIKGPMLFSDIVIMLLVLIVGCTGFLYGTRIGIRIKKRRKAKIDLHL